MTELGSDERTRIFAANVKSLRTSASLTQTDLARDMKERGFSFHQQTIQRIEDLQRPVRLDEAYALAEIFKTTIDNMSWTNETLRVREVDDFMYGAASLTTGIIRGAAEWYDSAAGMASHIMFQLENNSESERIEIGLALLHKMRESIQAMYRHMEGEVGAKYLNRIWPDHEDDERDESSIPEIEKRIDCLLESNSVRDEYLNMSAYELTDLYAPTRGIDL